MVLISQNIRTFEHSNIPTFEHSPLQHYRLGVENLLAVQGVRLDAHEDVGPPILPARLFRRFLKPLYFSALRFHADAARGLHLEAGRLVGLHLELVSVESDVGESELAVTAVGTVEVALAVSLQAGVNRALGTDQHIDAEGILVGDAPVGNEHAEALATGRQNPVPIVFAVVTGLKNLDAENPRIMVQNS